MSENAVKPAIFFFRFSQKAVIRKNCFALLIRDLLRFTCMVWLWLLHKPATLLFCCSFYLPSLTINWSMIFFVDNSVIRLCRAWPLAFATNKVISCFSKSSASKYMSTFMHTNTSYEYQTYFNITFINVTNYGAHFYY